MQLKRNVIQKIRTIILTQTHAQAHEQKWKKTIIRTI